MKIYIAGPISGQRFYKEKFARAEADLKAAGWEVLNPAANEGPEYRDYIDQGLLQLMQCDAIYLLRGHVGSAGALLEQRYAFTVEMPIYFQVEGVPKPGSGTRFRKRP